MRKCVDCSWYQVGITSFGTAKCGVGDPGVYTKVAAYLMARFGKNNNMSTTCHHH